MREREREMGGGRGIFLYFKARQKGYSEGRYGGI